VGVIVESLGVSNVQSMQEVGRLISTTLSDLDTTHFNTLNSFV
jgi:hypothetical protein